MKIALAAVLLVGSELMIRTFQAVQNIDPGFSRPEDVQAVRVSISESQVKAPEAVMRMQEAILRKFQGIAGVLAVAITNAPPMEGGSNNSVFVADHDVSVGNLPPVRRIRHVSPGSVAAVGSALWLAGPSHGMSCTTTRQLP